MYVPLRCDFDTYCLTKKLIYMKKLVLSVIVTLAIYAFLYVLSAFVHMSFNPNDWGMDKRLLYCFFASTFSFVVNLGIWFGDKIDLTK